MDNLKEFLNKLQLIWNYQIFSTEKVSIHVYHLFGLLLIYIFTAVIIRYAGKIVKRQIKTKGLDQGRTLALFKIAKYIFIVTAILIGMDVLGIQISLLLGGAAALLVGVGLGLQATFNDIFSGIILLFERSVAVGDILEVDGIIGRVVDIRIRTSELATFDNISIILPNSKIINNNIINWSHNKQLTRFTVSVGVSYGSDVQLVKKILNEVALEHPAVDNSRPADIFFKDFGDSALIFELKFWSYDLLNVNRTRSDLRYAIDAKFRENKISIPFPQRDIHIRSTVKVDD